MKDQKWPARRSRLKRAIYLNTKFKSSARPKGRTVVRRQGRSTELRPPHRIPSIESFWCSAHPSYIENG